jgi:hypothetical protein
MSDMVGYQVWGQNKQIAWRVSGQFRVCTKFPPPQPPRKIRIDDTQLQWPITCLVKRIGRRDFDNSYSISSTELNGIILYRYIH